MRVPKHVWKALVEARKSATMENANFNNILDPGLRIEGMTADEFIKERTRIYRETWVISRLDEAIKWAKGV